MNKFNSNESKPSIVKINKERITDLELQQREEASNLEKLQMKHEENMRNQLYMNQTDYTVENQPQQPQNQFIMPGAAVQPTYQVVNPFAGNHNYQPVPVVYDPSIYGVQYDNAIPPQHMGGMQPPVLQDGNMKEPQLPPQNKDVYLNNAVAPNGEADAAHGQMV